MPGQTNAISNLALKITSVVESCLSDAFEAHGVLSKEEICGNSKPMEDLSKLEHS